MYLKHIPLQRSGCSNIVDRAYILISPPPPSSSTATLTSGEWHTRTDPHHRRAGIRAFGHKEHSEHLIDTSEMTCVNLNNIDCIRLVELFEYYPIVCVFASGNANAARFEFAPNMHDR